MIGDAIGGMAIAILILEKTGSATALSLGMVANLVPPLVLGPAVAGLAYASLGAWWWIAINAGTLFAAVVCFSLCRLRYDERKVAMGRITMSEMGEGFLFFKEVRPAMYLRETIGRRAPGPGGCCCLRTG